MKRADLGAIFRYNGELVEVFAINDGRRAVVFKPLNKPPCPTCGHDHRIELIESSPLFQDNAEPVETLGKD